MRWEQYNGNLVAHTFETRRMFNDVIGTYDDDPNLTSEVPTPLSYPTLATAR